MKKTGLTRVIWTDKKWFSLYQEPNKKNTVDCAPVNPHQLIPCRKAHGEKVMAWVAIVDGRCLPVHWFEGSVNRVKYLEMLKMVMWPSVHAVATRRQYWFQQDGAPLHVTSAVVEFFYVKVW